MHGNQSSSSMELTSHWARFAQRWANRTLAGPYVVIGVDVSVDRARRGVAKRQKEDVNVEHPVEVGEHLRTVLQRRTARRWVKEGCETTLRLDNRAAS